ncbi:uncharacterized protein G2W53_042036 [Senna tora]|uniref:Uncharacterized protein n=1 Tax=Senna tora TaxID=362788 RepID=A0A834VZL8_9FABA|nr:uncharacterized protein G2W53_042036 [Senna tora]
MAKTYLKQNRNKQNNYNNEDKNPQMHKYEIQNEKCGQGQKSSNGFYYGWPFT